MRLKKWLPLVTGLLLWLPVFTTAQTLFSYGKHKVSKEEFLKAYTKNNPEGKATRSELEEYLELYVRYRLKIQWALDQQLDTLPSVKMDGESFRNQIAGHYLSDDSTLQVLVKQAISRATTDRKIAHIYVAKGTDSAQALKKISAAKTALESGASFEQVALQFSEDPAVVQNKGTIGWITVFGLPYALENLAYETPVNGISPLLSAGQAFHLFKILDSRPAQGKTSIAHIFLELGKKEEAAVRKRADSIYQAIRAGAAFSKLAQAFSEDDGSYLNGGELPPFTVGTYDAGFEDLISKLEKPGDVSPPYKSSQGYHIIQLLSKQGVTDAPGEEYQEEMRNKVLASDRSQLTTDMAYRKAARLTGLKLIPVTDNRNAASLIATIGKREITEGGFQLYRQEQAGLRREKEQAPSEEQERMNYIRQQVMQHYLQNLEAYNPLFAAQLKEYREGTLIFEAMQQQVWDKAASDEAGLENYYRQHKQRYTWKESFRGVLFTCSDEATAAALYQQLEKQPANWSAIATGFRNTVVVDSGRYEYEQLPFPAEAAKIVAGSLSRPLPIPESDQVGFIYCWEKLAAGLPRSFQEARGYILNDYQTQLEENWILDLKKTFPVKVNKAVLNSFNR
ncbi:peptidylprolyl isomerase [Flavihumibacter sp. CACIAM 22H1]|uniref:peptidylprolyl isomerase n=1 Tax=Flavihumibacter sp. CACIAM 22H1 TaxID=1812911 RepID=UPI0007A834FC|nr:peptidylprolyl isomerase [Flavihumibacter sp. CACIAM 22H1]KYP15448.1 MAG: hypothetical protein A1D16_13085 [Flavihumibacter sp. CACIAM 22H1]